jgi:hypothetical protein
MISHHWEIYNPPLVVDKSVQSSANASNLVDFSNVSNLKVNLNIINKITAEGSKTSRSARVPDQNHCLRISGTPGMMDIEHSTQNSSTRQAGLDVILIKLTIAEAINQPRQSQKVMITRAEFV